MAHLDADVIDLLRRARKEWQQGCNCAVCFAIDRYESNRISRDSLVNLVRVWIDENGPRHDGAKFWSRRRTELWS